MKDALTAAAKIAVTPLAGVWIEIREPVGETLVRDVTPLAGVWIEIRNI